MLLFLIASNAVLIGGILYYERKDKKEFDQIIFEIKNRMIMIEQRQFGVESQIAAQKAFAVKKIKPLGNGERSLLDRAGIKKKGPQPRPRA